ncbi:DUF805 domain-containing protein [Lactococcus fujiensis]|uniref:Transporter n=1 Tax=Lactococcus fujiensis JCM 16395 TaxID=1291764 RepID=A0A2A5RIX7_9LACT|nr:DUF805 domain-containing protein [Lactococcus fujiensis]PCR99024.1 hypothetical protein RT41_GL000534 [Lactococcus fujiensis JCM 16395]
MIKAYKKYWKKALKFEGFSSRSDYWWVFLVNSIIYMLISFLSFLSMMPAMVKIMTNSTGLSQPELVAKAQELATNPSGFTMLILALSIVFGLAILIPNVSLIYRRLNDAGMPTFVAYIFGLAAFYGIFSRFITAKEFTFVATAAAFITYAVYILCLFPTKYRDEEDDDSRNYD